MTTPDHFIASVRSWAEFFNRATTLPVSAPGNAPDKGKVFERLTQLYLKTHPVYQTKLKHVWRAKDELPSPIRSKIGLPRTDEGIDLVAETFDGDLWAIQCKFRADTHKPLTVTELATFVNLSFNVCRNVSLAVVAHTCAKPVKKSNLLGKTTEIGLERWLELEAEDWHRIQAATTKAPPRPKPREPRPHQQRAIAAAKQHFQVGSASRGRLLMPCGTGKSLTAFWIANTLKARSILVAVPSLHLIKQSLADWTREFLAHGEIPDWLCVCSDESTGKLERDEFVSGSYELGVDATTDPREIEKFLARKSGKRKIVFTTYHSGQPLASAARARKFVFDLGIMDEAHRTVGSLDKSFGHLLPNKNIAIVKRLFMTATERVVREKDETVLSMDDLSVYGECFHQLTFKEAIETKPPIISDYKVLTITVSDERVKQFIEENRYLKTADSELGEREAQALAAGIALQRAFREEGVRHAISFHRSIRAAEDFKDQQEHIEQVRPNKARSAFFHISSRKTAGERADLIRAFRESPSALITNARCLQEGVDIPAVDCVLFADPKQSVVDIVQAAGRAMRPSKDKRYGYIVVPIIVPSNVDFSEFAETTAFRQVARVITALSTQDDRIAEEFRGVTAKGLRNGDRIVEIKGDVPVAQRIDLNDFRDQIRLKLWERVGRANWRRFDEAREFARGLGLESREGWSAFIKSGRLPPDIPAKPYRTYRDKGWVSMGDWLGTGTIATRLREYMPFAKAREFSRTLGLKSAKEWRAFAKSDRLPPDIPANPSRTYCDKGWAGWGDWLGTGTIAPRLRKYRSFPKAREFAQSLELKKAKEWRAFTKSDWLPSDIPAAPELFYRDKGWVSYGDWLGTGTIANFRRKYFTFEKAREFARGLGLKSEAEWRAFTKSDRMPADIPATPGRTYRDKGWEGMGDWLGTGTIASQLRNYRTFEKAREFARGLGLKSEAEWRAFTKSDRMPADIPFSPKNTYRNKGWAGMGDWLGTGNIASKLRNFRPFEKARSFARDLGLKGEDEWRAFTKSDRMPSDIPATPGRTYHDKGWAGMGDWLGTGNIATYLRRYLPFEKAREFARDLGLRNREEWNVFTKSGSLPADIPATPGQAYLDLGWSGWGDWLGTGTIATYLRRYLPFEKARTLARNLGLKSREEWRVFIKSGRLPADIPASPGRTYHDKGWKSWGDWLGTGTIAPQRREYRPFPKARAFARSLKLKGQGEWSVFTKSGRLPADIPACPNQTYRGKGWESWGNWLGTGTIAPRLREYQAFPKARAFARNLGLKSQAEWFAFIKKGRLPADIPAAPGRTYRGKGWESWGDWLGTGTIASHLRDYRTFEKAREFARGLGLRSGSEWWAFIKSGRLPSDIPSNPDKSYRDNGWEGYGDWLGTGTVAPRLRSFRPFAKAREFARNLGLKSAKEWQSFTKSSRLPADIPTGPGRTYQGKGWAGWGDWLGTGTIAPRKRKYRPFAKAREFARSLKLKSSTEWWTFCKSDRLPTDIPTNPHRTYRNKGWRDMGDWLGNRRPPRNLTNSSKGFRKRSRATSNISILPIRNRRTLASYHFRDNRSRICAVEVAGIEPASEEDHKPRLPSCPEFIDLRLSEPPGRSLLARSIWKVSVPQASGPLKHPASLCCSSPISYRQNLPGTVAAIRLRVLSFR